MTAIGQPTHGDGNPHGGRDRLHAGRELRRARQLHLHDQRRARRHGRGTVAVTVTPVNDNPVAVNDTLRLLKTAPAPIVAVLANDPRPTGETRSVTAAAQPTTAR